MVRRSTSLLVASFVLALAADVSAQRPRGGGRGGAAGRDKAAPAPEPAARESEAPSPSVPAAASSTLVPTTAGGLTAEKAGQRAAATSFQVQAALENAEAADARKDAAIAAFLPRIAGKASYTRLSSFTMPNFAGDGSFVGTPAPSGTLNPTPTFAINFAFPQFFDNYLLQATATVPISDYFLRLTQNYSAASQSREAARWDGVAARAKSSADGQLAYYQWVRAKGAVFVAEQALQAAKLRKRDAENGFNVGNASRADVLTAETAVASAELGVEKAKNVATVAEMSLRTVMHAGADEVLAPGEGLDNAPPPFKADFKSMLSEALANRPEIKSIDASAQSASKTATVARAGRLPVIAAFGQADYANPNQRQIPQQQTFFPTWAAGVQATWSPNDALLGGAQGAESDARARNLEAQKGVVRDGIQVEVTQAYQNVLESEFALDSTSRQLASAQEAYRVARELFVNGRATGTQLTEAELGLTRARFEFLNARVDGRTARVRLEHALGRNAKALAQ